VYTPEINTEADVESLAVTDGLGRSSSGQLPSQLPAITQGDFILGGGKVSKNRMGPPPPSQEKVAARKREIASDIASDPALR
jgi:hypothetical protein